MNNNVHLLPVTKKPPRRGRRAMRDTLPAEHAEILQFDRPTDDAGVLADIAPWMQERPNYAERWLSSLFASRLGRCIEETDGKACLASSVWKTLGHNVRGTVVTLSGRLRVDVWCREDAGHVTFYGHRSTLLRAGIASPGWLHTELRKGRKNNFQSVAFDAQRTVNVTRSGEYYFVRIQFTEEEAQSMGSPECVAKAQSDVQREIDGLPKTAARYMEFFTGMADLQTRTMQMVASESRGGFALDDSSRAAILTQLDSLRQAIYRAKAKFDRGERRSEIACIVQKHAPSNMSTSGART
ncbi:hypothetical protein R69608_00353 [Paraburkholderia nemoris]|uniref:hypothetical protein n=1 Tax=Paraburkholderia nemoris TaxID=2793076 RepID=UPI0019133255|nr:hypothetical protein [Paraburkholderia nemoris]MBK5146375.1 hypothetical protein [Burkholderia sp. R-69608]CAE6863917.1 hypothetical protein R69608_00353 [Paraburkholderia nemoris]